jgi:hypothetical protein
VRRIALLGLLISTVAAGCGGGSDHSTTQVTGQPNAGASTNADYIELADTICRNHQSRREDLESQARDLGPLTSPAKAHRVAGLLHEEADNLRAEIKELQSRRPAVPNLALASFFSAVRARAMAIDQWATAYEDLHEARIRKLQIRVGFVAAAVDQRARKYGFATCGR